MRNCSHRGADARGWMSVRREKVYFFSRCNSYPAKVAPAGSYRSGGGGNKTVEAFEKNTPLGGVASKQAVMSEEAESPEIDMGLTPPPKVEKLQAALHTKAKGVPSYRFYALYDKLYRKDILQHAFNCCLANRGVAGVDGVTFDWIKAYGQEKWLDELAEELRQQTYRPQPVRRVNIPNETLDDA